MEDLIRYILPDNIEDNFLSFFYSIAPTVINKLDKIALNPFKGVLDFSSFNFTIVDNVTVANAMNAINATSVTLDLSNASSEAVHLLALSNLTALSIKLNVSADPMSVVSGIKSGFASMTNWWNGKASASVNKNTNEEL
jgi:hypothetical protein